MIADVLPPMQLTTFENTVVAAKMDEQKEVRRLLYLLSLASDSYHTNKQIEIK